MDRLETGPYARKSADLAWQLFVACAAIVAISYPVILRFQANPILAAETYLFFHPLLLCISYLYSSLAPPGSQTSFFGLVTLPIEYLPYLMLGLSLLMGGPLFAARSLPGALVGHLWWWGVWGDQVDRPGPFANFGKAPRWLANWLGDAGSAGYKWGSGQRLGSS
ncbi:hypothetical protein PQX77_005592 [Marasmius sp. AFHP31]|nr:hypothetical protein PQX77_005592 [Marasmius sp. AFHP31]